MRSDREIMTQKDLRAEVDRAVSDRSALDGMRKSFRTIIDRQRENARRIPDLDARKERLRRTKEASVGNEALLIEAIASLRGNGFRVIVAKDAEAALRVVREELRGYDLVVKSKSNVTKELHLAEALRADGIEVVETDLGDRIVQLAGCEAVHPTGPACHMTRAEISRLFSKHFDRVVSEDPAELTRVMRDEIASYIARARVGITGANAIAANEGAVVIVHNEGNAAKCAMLPDKHIVITTPEKVVPTLDDAVNVTKLQTYLSTGKIISSYINVITGPSYTADIEKKVYHGMHGPKEVVVLFVDDGRLSAADKEAQYCIGCGMCLVHCPTYNVVGPVFGSSGHMGGIGVYLEGSMGKDAHAIDSGLYLCTSCGACTEVCPTRIDTKKGIAEIRKRIRASKAGLLSEHNAVILSVRNYDNPWQVPRKQRAKWSARMGLPRRGDVLYFSGCSTSLLFSDNAPRVVRLLEACGIKPAHLGEAEPCCGSIVRKLGDDEFARSKAEQCFEAFRAAGAKTVVTSCPGCSSALKHYPDIVGRYGIEVVHISEFLDGRLDRSKLGSVQDLGRATFHDPCDLGRLQGVYDAPRRLLAAVPGCGLIEMERSKAGSACCGAGSGVRSAYPGLAASIASDRIRMAREAGADTVVTSCPWCLQSLRDCQGTDQSVRVVDLVEALDESVARR